jgi:hypothetical protein
MLEKAQEKNLFPKSEIPEKQLYRKILEDFISDVPIRGHLFEIDELDEGFRAFAFGQIFERLKTILRGFGTLSKVDQEDVLARIDTMKKEAHRWSHRSGSRDFERELDEMVARATAASSMKPKLRIVREKIMQ